MNHCFKLAIIRKWFPISNLYFLQNFLKNPFRLFFSIFVKFWRTEFEIEFRFHFILSFFLKPSHLISVKKFQSAYFDFGNCGDRIFLFTKIIRRRQYFFRAYSSNRDFFGRGQGENFSLSNFGKQFAKKYIGGKGSRAYEGNIGLGRLDKRLCDVNEGTA